MRTAVVIDGGGRGSALVDAYARSPHIDKVIAVPGNDFMQTVTEKPVQTFPTLKTTDITEIIEISKIEHVSLVDVAQDNAVAVGLVDRLQEEKIPVIGPTKLAGEIEWNKAFSRDFMARHGIPQPSYAIFSSEEDGIRFLSEQPDKKWFIKAAGLAEGKGALPAESNDEAIERIQELRKFGDASNTYLVEEWLTGENGEIAEEFSSFAISDGEHVTLLGHAQDHKRVFNGDRGPNTGGMGSVTPPLVITNDINRQVEAIFSKTVHGLKEEGREYKGVLFFGGILVPEAGKQKVYGIEFNARWGDPEAQVVIPGIQSDFFELNEAARTGNLDSFQLNKDDRVRIAVAGTAMGYPIDYSEVRGKKIHGLAEAKKVQDITIYGAGIKEQNDQYTVNGGRVLYVVSEGETVRDARSKAYEAMEEISIEGNNLHYRNDIGWRDIIRTQKPQP